MLLAGCSFGVSGVTVGGDADLAMGAPVDLAGQAPGDLAMGMPGDMPTTPVDMATKPGRRKSITIDNTKVNGNQTDFPVWIDLTDSDIAARAQPSGSDIYFTAADGTTVLDYEIQGWNATTHRLSAWVRVPALAGNAPTVLYVYYGDPAATAMPNAAGVFKSSFSAVWHLEDATSATTIADATGTHAGTPSFSTTTQVAAKLGGGLSFTGGNDNITFNNNILGGNQAHTVSVWINQQAVAHSSSIIVMGTAVQGQARWMYGHYTGPAMAIGYYSDD